MTQTIETKREAAAVEDAIGAARELMRYDERIQIANNGTVLATVSRNKVDATFAGSPYVTTTSHR